MRRLCVFLFFMTLPFVWGIARAAEFPSPAPDFPNNWEKIVEATCVHAEGVRLESTAYGQPTGENSMTVVSQMRRNGVLIIQTRANLVDGSVVASDAFVLRGEHIESFASSVDGDGVRMRTTVHEVLGMTLEEFIACAKGSHEGHEPK